MRELSFIEQADQTLRFLESRIEQIADTAELDLDLARQGGVLTLEWVPPSGPQCTWVIHIQEAVHELWVASPAGAHHFKWNAEQQQWLSTREQGNLNELLASWLTALAGKPLQL